MENLELAQIMLEDARTEGDSLEVQKIQRRIDEATRRVANVSYWGSIVDHAEQTVKSGCDLEAIINSVSKALNILKAAVPASA